MEVIGKIIGALLAVAIASTIGGILVWILWDDCMTSIFGIRDITFWEALTLSWLCGTLFKSTSTSNNKE